MNPDTLNDSSDHKQLRLDNRHLAFLFLGGVAVCAIFFSLGFVVGRGQAYEVALGPLQDASLRGASPGPQESPADSIRDSVTVSAGEEKPSEAKNYSQDLDFYSAVKDKKVDENFHPEPTGSQRNPISASSSTQPAAPRSTVAPSPSGQSAAIGSVSLQVAALRNLTEAERLASTLRSKGFAASIVRPAAEARDELIRVHVGPFRTLDEANKVKAQLQKEGYQAITRR
ncbi:MAG: SPOR domain-containing protein [Acidobacteriota bacterium]